MPRLLMRLMKSSVTATSVPGMIKDSLNTIPKNRFLLIIPSGNPVSPSFVLSAKDPLRARLNLEKAVLLAGALSDQRAAGRDFSMIISVRLSA